MVKLRLILFLLINISNLNAVLASNKSLFKRSVSAELCPRQL